MRDKRRATRVVALLSAVAIAAGCNGGTASPKPAEDWKLSSGRTVRPLQVLRSLPDIDPPFLLLAYATSLDLRDTLALRDEAHAVWPRFLPLVRHAGVSKAVLQANASSFRINLPFMSWFQTQRRFTFVLNRQLDGTWQILGDTASLTGGVDTTFPSFGSKCKFAPLAPRPLGAAPRCPKRSILARPDSG